VAVTVTSAGEGVRWWSIRRAQNTKPVTYRCPLCDRNLAALSEHVLISPEGDSSRRRHAHTECVLKARKAGTLPSQDEWRRSKRAEPSGRRRGPAAAVRRLTSLWTRRSP
jgi:hypothetical protein